MRWKISSETGVLTDVLLCRPDNYRWLETNSIALNTLANEARFNHAAAVRQYDGLVETLERAGAQPHFLELSDAHPYQVYTRDSSQTTPWGPVLTQLAMPERRGEYGALLDFHLSRDGFYRYATRGVIEGGDIHIVRPGLLIVGYSGGRTDLEGAQQFGGWFEAEGWEVRLQPFAEYFLHLDVLFCMATDRLAVACAEVLGTEFVDFLKRRGIDIVPASYAEVMEMSCNLLALGDDRVLSPAHSRRINEELRQRGVTVLDPPLDIFARGGGSIHCMTMPLHREPLA